MLFDFSESYLYVIRLVGIAVVEKNLNDYVIEYWIMIIILYS